MLRWVPGSPGGDSAASAQTSPMGAVTTERTGPRYAAGCGGDKRKPHVPRVTVVAGGADHLRMGDDDAYDDDAYSDGYLLANRQAAAARRLTALSAVFDPWTLRHLRDAGLGPGRRVWEVGAGGPALPEQLARAVAPGGEVLATDLDPGRLAAASAANLRVQRHDIGVDPPPDGPFDLVHARLVLVHVPQRGRALAAMASALRPGGWLVVEDADPTLQPLVCLDDTGPAQQLANRLKASFRQLMTDRGVDLAYGRTLPRRLRELGLTQVCAEAYFPIGGPAAVELERAGIAQIREALVAAGLAAESEIERHLDNLSTGLLDPATSPLVTAWGRRP